MGNRDHMNECAEGGAVCQNTCCNVSNKQRFNRMKQWLCLDLACGTALAGVLAKLVQFNPAILEEDVGEREVDNLARNDGYPNTR